MPDWSLPSTLEATSVHHGYATAKAPQEALPYPDQGGLPGYRLARVAKLWYAKLDPGGFILPHTDQGPWVERWHYPISGRGYVWGEWEGRKSYITLRYYDPYRMNHHRPHAVWNPYDEPRVILIVEYDNPIDESTRDLEVFDPLPEMADLVQNATQMTRV